MGERVPILLAALPAAWRQLIQVELPAAMWCASPDRSDRRVWSRAAEGSTYLLSHTESSTGALIPVEGGDAVLHAFLPPAAQPALIQDWDITRPWHPRSGTCEQCQHLQQQPEQQLQGEQQPGQQLQRVQQQGEQQLPEGLAPPTQILHFSWGLQSRSPTGRGTCRAWPGTAPRVPPSPLGNWPRHPVPVTSPTTGRVCAAHPFCIPRPDG